MVQREVIIKDRAASKVARRAHSVLMGEEATIKLLGKQEALEFYENMQKASSLLFTQVMTKEAEAAMIRGEMQAKQCPICLNRKMDLALGCGHTMCTECWNNIKAAGRDGKCPVCRTPASNRQHQIYL